MVCTRKALRRKLNHEAKQRRKTLANQQHGYGIFNPEVLAEWNKQ